MRHRIFLLLLATLVSFTGRAAAVIGTADDVPAATLLLPYFEVDQDNVTGRTTLVAIRNADSASVVAHVTVWSNLSVPVLTFDIYLTGYDQQTFNMRDILVGGNLPRTGPSDILSPRGPLSGPHSTFGGTCSSSPGLPPAYTNPALSATLLAHLKASLTGQFSNLLGGCAGAPTAKMVGYVTIDAVNRCNLMFPSSAGYFTSGGQGVASNRNALWGSWIMVDSASDWSEADTLVHLEASATHPLTSTPGNYTFYGRYVGGSAADNRERLTGRWNAPLEALVDTEGSAELVVWRDSGRSISAFNCANPPAVFPLGSTEISAISQEGLATPLAADSFPWETQRTVIAEDESWMRLDLDTSNGSAFDPAKQAHVTALRRSGVVSTAMGAVQAAGGVIGTADAAPGASLLLPYFEADPANAMGLRTAFTVRNGSAAPVQARVVLWTDRSVPTIGFDLYLPGFGSRVVDLREIFATGQLPASGPSPLPGCAGVLPPAPLSASTLAALVAAHTGASSQLFGGLCGGSNQGDGVARVYVTADAVTRCTAALPGQPGYFGAGGAVSFDNVLWGEYGMIEPDNNLAHGDTLAHMQASTTDPLTALPGMSTFYSRYVTWTAADRREALPSTWGVSSIDGGAFNEGASLLVWRDSGHVHQPFTCGSPHPAFPLNQGTSLHFDEQAQFIFVPPFALDLETQKRAVDWNSTGPFFGYLSLGLGTRTGAFHQPPLQSFVTSLERAELRFGISISGVQLQPHILFTDGFETGDFVGWWFKTP
jgi:hypothetical protein